MNKKNILSLVHKCALLYNENLCNQQLLFIYLCTNNQLNYVEVPFRSYHFLHFTGLLPRQNLSAKMFYSQLLNGKLSPNDFTVKNPVTTALKIEILPAIIKIDKTARMIGNYNGPHLELYTEKVVGTTTACIGLIKRNKYYIPNSILHEDIRDISDNPIGKIVCILKKNSSEYLYSHFSYKKKDFHLDLSLLPKEISSKISSTLF